MQIHPKTWYTLSQSNSHQLSAKMSSPAILAAILSLEAQLSALKAQLSLPSASGPLKPSALPTGKKAPKKEEKEKKERKTSDWALFTQRVRALLKEGGYEKKDLSVGCLQFCGDLKKENADFSSWASEDILAKRAAWVVPEGKRPEKSSVASGAASVVSADGDAEAPSEASAEPKKRGPKKGTKLTEEQKAQRKATRESNKAAKSSSEDEAEAPASDTEGAVSTTSSEKKKRGPKKYSEMTPEELAAAKAKREAKKEAKSASPSLAAALPPLPPSPSGPKASAALANFQPVMLGGHRYYINLASGYAYNRNEDGSQGHWAGLFSRTPKPHVDFSVAEPEFTDLDELD